MLRRNRFFTGKLLLLVLMLCGLAVYGSQPEIESVTILKLGGDVTASDTDGTTLSLVQGAQIPEGYTITTGSDGFIEVIWGESGWARIDRGTTVTIQNTRYKQGDTSIWAKLKLTVGQVWFDLLHRAGDVVDFTVETPTVTAGVRGTAFSVEQTADGFCLVSVQRGLVRATSEQLSVDVGAESYIRFGPDGNSAGVQKWTEQVRAQWQHEMSGKYQDSGEGSPKGRDEKVESKKPSNSGQGNKQSSATGRQQNGAKS